MTKLLDSLPLWLAFVIVIGLLGLVFLLELVLYNWLAPVFGLPQLSYLQMVGLSVLLSMLFGRWGKND